jgi:hypothetical protein
VALRKRVKISIADELQANEARAAITLHDGRRIETSSGPCLGSAQRPMSDEQIEEKFLAQTSDLLGDARARKLAWQCWNLPAADDVRQAAPGCWG